MSTFSINRVVLIGRLTRDPELRALPSGANVCGLRIACNSRRRDGDTYVDKPNYFDVSVFGAGAESVARFMHKGSQVGVDGRLEWREWETEAEKRQAVSVVADSVQFLDSRDAAAGDGHSGEDGEPAEDGALVGAGPTEGDLAF